MHNRDVACLGYLRNLTQPQPFHNLSKRSHNGRVLPDEGRVVSEWHLTKSLIITSPPFTLRKKGITLYTFFLASFFLIQSL